MVPLIGPGYRAVDQDEKGMWQQMERVEEEVSGSNLLIKDPQLTAYLGDLIGRVGGPAGEGHAHLSGAHSRIQRDHVPDRLRGGLFGPAAADAQRSAAGRGRSPMKARTSCRKHQLRQWRDVRRKTDIFSFLAMGAGLAGGATGVYAGDLVQLAQLGTILSLLKYNRTLEAEADAMGVRLLADAGYDPMAMSETWEQLIGELDLSAKYRRKRRDRDFSLFETHPAPETRMADLRISAAEVKQPGKAL